LLIDEDQFPTNNELLLEHPNLISHRKSDKKVVFLKEKIWFGSFT
jgi:hypothetical protein